MCASQWVFNKPGGAQESTGGGRSAAFGIPFPRGRGAPETAAFHLWKWRSLSAHGGTRKMVNYARTGRGQRKLGGGSVGGSDVQIDRQIWV
ncbi:hypothetical protein JTE90_014860 [Oedothorax gibbosus]|uniref:Uncharacterized protein n=1 Tax=Oedothorax gibbosus TaxID=931172 RepID=A0AAV6TJJ5_9ARAC|nr:hypothetical protein JTE90_014860 [Oedothorax gibbosus]